MSTVAPAAWVQAFEEGKGDMAAAFFLLSTDPQHLPTHSSVYITCRAQCKMKMHGPWF